MQISTKTSTSWDYSFQPPVQLKREQIAFIGEAAKVELVTVGGFERRHVLTSQIASQ